MHYAVIIPVTTKESAEKVLAVIINSGLGAFIEPRVDNNETKESG